MPKGRAQSYSTAMCPLSSHKKDGSCRRTLYSKQVAIALFLFQYGLEVLKASNYLHEIIEIPGGSAKRHGSDVIFLEPSYVMLHPGAHPADLLEAPLLRFGKLPVFGLLGRLSDFFGFNRLRTRSIQKMFPGATHRQFLHHFWQIRTGSNVTS